MRLVLGFVVGLLLIGQAFAQTYNLNDLTPQELNLLSRGLFFVGGWDLHTKMQQQINAQEQARAAAFEQQRKAFESSLREQIKKELEPPQ